jgi:hypothetical protein
MQRRMCRTALIGDPLRLGQVLINLGNNAAKFTDHGRNSGGSRASGDIDAWQIELHFWVKDTGIGMTPEQMQARCSRASARPMRPPPANMGARVWAWPSPRAWSTHGRQHLGRKRIWQGWARPFIFMPVLVSRSQWQARRMFKAERVAGRAGAGGRRQRLGTRDPFHHGQKFRAGCGRGPKRRRSTALTRIADKEVPYLMTWC